MEEGLSRKAQQWFEELSELPRLCVPRCLRVEPRVKSITLHTFVDASQEAYFAVTYTRHLPCSMKILRAFYFADWRFFVVCGNTFLRFEMTEISVGN